jgi:hypothetical protein
MSKSLPFLFAAIPVILLCVGASVAGVWAVSRMAGFSFNPAIPAVFSAVLASAAIARGRR